MRTFARHAGSALTLCGILVACASPTPPPRPAADGGFDVVAETAAMEGQSEGQRQAWLAYALARGAAYQKLRDARKNPSGDDFLIELRARELLAGYWRDQRAKEAGASDPYLDRLVALDDQKHLAEHVLASLAKPGWTTELDLLQRAISDHGGKPQWYVPPGSNTSVTVCPPS